MSDDYTKGYRDGWNDREARADAQDPACMRAVASNEPCETNDSNYKRCTICGFVVDTSFAAEKPTIDFTMAGRAKKAAALDPL